MFQLTYYTFWEKKHNRNEILTPINFGEYASEKLA